MTHSERSIMQAVLRYNGVPDCDHAEHIEQSRESGRGNLDRRAYRSYRIIWNSLKEFERVIYSRENVCRQPMQS